MTAAFGRTMTSLHSSHHTAVCFCMVCDFHHVDLRLLMPTLFFAEVEVAVEAAALAAAVPVAVSVDHGDAVVDGVTRV